MRRHLAVFLVASGLLGAACADDSGVTAGNSDNSSGTERPDDSTSGTETGAGIDTSSFGWQSVGGDDRLQEGWLEVPVDHDDPSQGTLRLYVVRHLADPETRIGSLLVNPGGPGFGGSILALSADGIYSEELLAHFDIVGWDPRGTGLSEPALDCIDDDDYDRFYASADITPETDAERQTIVELAEEFATSCAERNAALIQYIGTNASARDMDLIRQALGEEQISYFGFSYGSELGATWATLFPETVRAAVLDGASDPTADFFESSLQQTAGFEDTLQRFLDQCAEDPDCAFHSDGDTETAFDDLMNSLDRDPVPTEPGRPDANLVMAVSAIAQAMYTDQLWDILAEALAAARDGDGSGLLELYDSYYQREFDGSYPDSLEAFQTIFCMDRADRPSVEEEDATVPEFAAVAPRMSPGTTGTYFCTFFPASTDPRVEITGKGAGPVLVMGTTGDAATPLSSTRAMARALEDGRLVIVDADQHTGYGVNGCSFEVVDQFLIDPEGSAPADGTECN